MNTNIASPAFKGYFAYKENNHKPLKLGNLVQKSFSTELTDKENICLIKVAPEDDEFIMEIITKNPDTQYLEYEQEKPNTKGTWDDRVMFLIDKYFSFGQL